MPSLPDCIPSTKPFIALMVTIWEGTSESMPDGGVVLFMSEWYAQWSDARQVAKALGARCLYAAGPGWMTWEWPDELRVAISLDGNGVRPIRRHLYPSTRAHSRANPREARTNSPERILQVRAFSSCTPRGR